MKRKVWHVVAVALVIGLLVAGCGGGGNSNGGSQKGQEKVLTVGQRTNVSTLDVQMQGKLDEMAVLINIFDPLVTRDKEGKLAPSLATSWKQVNDKTWQFKLREGVKFHDGEDFNAEAVKFSIERILDPKQKSPITELRTFERVDVVDPYTVNIITKVPDPLLPDKLTLFGGCIVPPKYIKEHGGEYFASHPVGTGPFKFVEWVKDDHVTLEANKDYWQGPPKLDRVVFKGIPDDADRVAALQSGQIDIATEVPPLSIDSLKNASKLRIDSVPGVRIYYLSVVAKEGPLADKRVRQAVSYAIDTKMLIDTIVKGQGKQIGQPCADSLFGYNPEVKPYPYDLEKAKQLLSQAGYGNGFTVKFSTTPGIYEDLTQAISGMLVKVGIKTEVEVLPWAQYVEKYSKAQLAPLWDLGYTMWQGDPQPLIDTFFRSGKPRAIYASPQADKLIDSMQKEMDPAKREQQVKQLMAILHEDAPWVNLFQANDVYGVSKRVQWQPPTNQVLNLYQVDVSAE